LILIVMLVVLTVLVFQYFRNGQFATTTTLATPTPLASPAMVVSNSPSSTRAPTPRPTPSRTIIQLPRKCPDVSGTYVRIGDNLEMAIKQSGCKIESDHPSRGFDHLLNGSYSAQGEFFGYITVRTSKGRERCATKLFGKLFRVDERHIRTEVYGTDGKCELAPNWTDTSMWVKR